MEGSVKTIAIDKGTGRRKAFGFIKAGDKEVFFHRTAVRNAEWDDVNEGDECEFDLTDGKDGKGPRAENVRIK